MTGAEVGLGRPLRASDPAELGPYKLLRRLGEGGMGSVYLAKRDGSGPLVAVKMIRKDLSSDPDFRRRFRSEVARAQQVPAFCTAEVLDADPDHEPPYLVVEFVNGPSLARVVQNQGPLTQANLHGLAIGVATALTAIHGAGVIHRDLKPANVLLAPGTPKVIDFGIARAAESSGSDTAPNQLIGTIPYMAPERLDPEGARAVTPAADIFAWGAIVAYAGTGRVPFGGGSAEAVAKILTQQPDLTGLTGVLKDLVEQALSKDPADRPSARELLDHLVEGGPRQTQQRLIEAATEQAVVTVPNVSDPTRLDPAATPTVKERRPGRVVVALLAASIVLLTATVVGMLTGAIKPILGAPGDGASKSPSPVVTTASPTPAPSPTPSASPSASPSPTSTDPVWPAGAGTVEVSEKLTAVGPWFVDRDELKTTCTHTSGGYKVTSTFEYAYRCHSQVNPFTNFTLEVEVNLRTAESCAAVWFRYDTYRGYLLTTCGDVFELHNHDDQSLIRLWRMPLKQVVKPKTTFKLGIWAQDNKLHFFHNGQFVATATDETYTVGRIAMGIDEPISTATPREVIYKNIVIRRLS